ncbi:hypothetical protein VTK56DRAFT_9599 [Thermocarpiscus australiensis]
MCYITVSHYRCGHKIKSPVRHCREYYYRRIPMLCGPTSCGTVSPVNLESQSDCSWRCELRLSEEVARWQRKEKEKREKLQKKSNKGSRPDQGKSRTPIAKADIKVLWETARRGTYDSRAPTPVQEEEEADPTPAAAQRAPPPLARRRILSEAYGPPEPLNPSITVTQADVGPQGAYHTQSEPSEVRMPFAPTPDAGISLSRSDGRRLPRRDDGTLVDPRTRMQAVREAQQRLGQYHLQVPENPNLRTVATSQPVMVGTSRTNMPTATRSNTATREKPLPPVPQAQVRSRPAGGQPSNNNARSPPRTQAPPPPPPRSQYQRSLPVPPNREFRPPVPPKDTWREEEQQRQQDANRPLFFQPGAADRIVPRKPAGSPSGWRTATPGYYRETSQHGSGPDRPLGASTSTSTTSRSTAGRNPGQQQQQQQPPDGGSSPAARNAAARSSPEYRPNPMFANRQGNGGSASRPPEVSTSTTAGVRRQQGVNDLRAAAGGGGRSGPSGASRPSTRVAAGSGSGAAAAAAAAQQRPRQQQQPRQAQQPQQQREPKRKKSGGWLRRLMAQPSTESLDFVCRDAARVEGLA